MDAAAILLHAVAVGIQREGRAVVAVDAGLCAVHLHPADVGHDAGQQDLVIIGLCQKVVAAHFQRVDDGVGIVQTGCEDDRAVVPAAQTLAEVYAVGVREKDVHQDDIELFPRMAQSVAARLCTDHLKILLTFQKIACGVADHGVIFHQQYADHPVSPPLFSYDLIYYSIPYFLHIYKGRHRHEAKMAHSDFLRPAHSLHRAGRYLGQRTVRASAQRQCPHGPAGRQGHRAGRLAAGSPRPVALYFHCGGRHPVPHPLRHQHSGTAGP